MKLITRSEEMVLLAVWRLKDEAYCVRIREYLSAETGKSWSFGSVFDPLERLEKKGLLRSFLSDPVNRRGGKSKRIYGITIYGRRELADLHRLQQSMWREVSLRDPEPEKVRP